MKTQSPNCTPTSLPDVVFGEIATWNILISYLFTSNESIRRTSRHVTIYGTKYEVSKGSVIFIPRNAEHGMRYAEYGELRWLYAFTAYD
jgi:hypothetical protein